MHSLLDVIGAVAIGGILLISMLNAMFTMQTNGNNLNNFLQLIKISEDVSDTIDSLYLARVGRGVDSLFPILANSVNSFEFLTVNPTTNNLDTILITQEAHTQKGYPLKVYRNSILEMGPFWLGDSLELKYYNSSEQETSIIDSIRSLSMDAEYTSTILPSEKKLLVVKNEIVIWKYFRSIFLR